MKYILALEGGATHTRAGLYENTGTLLRETEGGPANPSAYGIHACTRMVAAIVHELLEGIPAAAVDGYGAFAGAASAVIQEDMAAAIGMQLRLRSMTVTSDLYGLLHANAGAGPGILVIAGTGAAVLARDEAGRHVRTGGWGPLLGDEGSGYGIAAAALRACARAVDGVAPQTMLIENLPEAADLTSFNDFVAWSSRASKRDIAALAPFVAAAAEMGDIVACSCIEEEARRLAALALSAQEKLGLEDNVRLFEYGALLESCPVFRNAFRAAVNCYGEVQLLPCSLHGHHAAYELASRKETPAWARTWRNGGNTSGATLSVTEQSTVPVFLDTLSPQEIAATMHCADKEAVAAVGDVLDAVAEAIEAAAYFLREGGRIIYAGAGTSGRLGVLDASECPPTFGVSSGRVCALIAGGDNALRSSIEGAEDDRVQGMSDIEKLRVSSSDFVVGIAASGGTPYVLGALEKARAEGAKTALVTSNPAANAPVDILIAPDTGPEVLPGSTRLKAGSAAKLILNMISTGAMAQAGYVYQGRMVNMTPVNDKLRLRAQRIVAEICDVTTEAAIDLLSACNYRIPEAILMAKHSLSAEDAATELKRHKGLLRDALK